MLLFKSSVLAFVVVSLLLCLDVIRGTQVQSSLDETGNDLCYLPPPSNDLELRAIQEEIKNPASSKTGNKKKSLNKLVAKLKSALEKLLDTLTHENEMTDSPPSDKVSEEEKTKTFNGLRRILKKLQKEDMAPKTKRGKESLRAKLDKALTPLTHLVDKLLLKMFANQLISNRLVKELQTEGSMAQSAIWNPKVRQDLVSFLQNQHSLYRRDESTASSTAARRASCCQCSCSVAQMEKKEGHVIDVVPETNECLICYNEIYSQTEHLPMRCGHGKHFHKEVSLHALTRISMYFISFY
jgi:hypothetical protein